MEQHLGVQGGESLRPLLHDIPSDHIETVDPPNRAFNDQQSESYSNGSEHSATLSPGSSIDLSPTTNAYNSPARRSLPSSSEHIPIAIDDTAMTIRGLESLGIHLLPWEADIIAPTYHGMTPMDRFLAEAVRIHEVWSVVEPQLPSSNLPVDGTSIKSGDVESSSGNDGTVPSTNCSHA